MATIGEMLVRVGLDATAFNKEIKNIETGLRSLEAGLSTAGTALTAGLTVPIAALAAGSLVASGKMEALRNGLTAVTGSSEETAIQFERLTELAKLPGMGLSEVAQASINLQAAGQSAQTSEQWIRAFGNALAAVGRGKEDLSAVVTQLVQMSNKSSVLANDLRPIIERVPQLGAAIRETFGTLDTEVLQKLFREMGVSTTDFIDWMVTELGKIDPVSGGLQNAFETLGDSVMTTLSKIGDLLSPAVQALIPYVESLLDAITSLAEWFSGLPTGVQLAVGAIVAFAAALGPLMLIGAQLITAFTTLAPLFTSLGAGLTALGGVGGALTAAFNPVTLTIAAVAAALTLAWNTSEPFRESVVSIWNAIVNFADGLVTLGANIWNLVTGWEPLNQAVSWTITKIGELIGFVASLAINLLALPFQWLGDALSTINGLFVETDVAVSSMDQAMKKSLSGVQDHAAAQADAAMKTMGLVDATGKWVTSGSEGNEMARKAKKAMEEMAAAQKKAKEEAKKLAAQQKKLREEQERAEKVAAFYNEKIQGLTSSQGTLDTQLDKMTRNSMPAFIAKITDGKDAWEEQTKAIIALQPELSKLTDDMFPAFVTETKALEDAFGALGLKSTNELASMTSKAKEAYDTIIASDKTTQFQKDSALLALFKAQAAEAQATYGQIPKDLEQSIANMEAKLNVGMPKVKQPFKDFNTEVSTIVTNLAQDLGKSLFDGDLSFAEKMKGALKDIGSAAVSKFIQPFMDMIVGPQGLIAKALNPLTDKLTDIGAKLLGLGGDVASGVASGAGGAAGGVGGAAGGASGGAGAVAGGALGWVSAIGSVASAISGIVSNFQLARQENTLNAIEESTRYTKLYIGGDGGGNQAWTMAWAVNKTYEWLTYILDDLRGAGAMKETLWKVADNAYWSLKKFEGWDTTFLPDIASNTYWSLRKLEDSIPKFDSMVGSLDSIQDSMRAIADRPIQTVVNVYLDSQKIQQALGESAAFQGA